MYPVDINFLGMTYVFVDNNSSDISPKITFVIFWFIGIDNFVLNILLSVFKNSKFVTGFGDTILIAPWIDGFVIE